MGEEDTVGTGIVLIATWILGIFVVKSIGLDWDTFQQMSISIVVGTLITGGVVYFFGAYRAWPIAIPMLLQALKPLIQRELSDSRPTFAGGPTIPWYVGNTALALISFGLVIFSLYWIWRKGQY